MGENKTKPERTDVNAFIGAITDERQRADCETLAAMFARASGEPATMWGPAIIGFGNHHYRYASGREGSTMRIGFAPRRGQIVLYGFGGAERHAELLARMGKHSTGKGCVYLKSLASLDLDALEALCVAEYTTSRECSY